MICIKNAKQYCCEDISLIENYEQAIADKTHTWDCHHRAEILPCGRFSTSDLKKHGLYFNVPASQLLFLKQKDHVSLHHSGRPSGMSGKHLSEESRKRISNSHKGRQKSEETRRKLSEAHKGKKASEETRRKLSESHKRYYAERRAKQ